MNSNSFSYLSNISSLFLLVIFTLQGCGGKNDAQKSGESKVAASSAGNKAVVGKWKVSSAKQFPEDSIDKLYVFTADGKYEIGSGKTTVKGDYSIEDDMLSMDMGGGVKIRFKFNVNGNTLTLDGQNTQQGFTMQRQ